MDFADPGRPGVLASGLLARFQEAYGRRPDGVYAAPGRVNLIGEHLDYNGGRCLPFALPYATYVAASTRPDGRLTVRSTQMAEPWTGDVASLGPGSVSGWAAYVAGVVWALREEGLDVPGIDLLVDSRVPVGAGLSSSAALECSVALAACAAANVEVDDEVRQLVVRACVRAENDVAGASTGGMDQSVAMLAEAGHALLLDFAGAPPRQVPWDPGAGGVELLVIDTRVQHQLTDGGYGDRRAECEEAARQLGVDRLAQVSDLEGARALLDDDRLVRRVRHVVTEMGRVDGVVALLDAGDVSACGPLLTASHTSLRDDFEVSCEELDLVVETALQHGALGARMTGGGFGGSAIALAPAERSTEVAEAVTGAFADRGWRAPLVLRGEPSAGAHAVQTGPVGS